MKKSYWKYTMDSMGKMKYFALFIIAGMLTFWLLGFNMPVDSWIEGKYLIGIIGIPVLLFFVGNFIKWRKE